MTEWRTQEQVEADAELQRAIARVMQAYSDDPDLHDKFFLSEYLVITSQVGIAADKAQHTRYEYILSNGSIPWHNMMGLMDWGYLAMRSKMAHKDEDDNS